ncbi:MAG: hypothetical protein CVU56_21210 [Deltaproteobacteria bacterium HGW-Deltaproteobacteria-14]|nr:MAG: hypothetical protein CVU56_21210 [Deltaproteobacteria bacterium HGW-Deltaproteobacteria-14]
MSTVQNAETERLQRLSILATRAFLESGLRGIDAEVVVALDVSRTMAPMYLNGSIQELAESLLALAMRFDDDGVVPAWSFGDEAALIGDLDKDGYVGWVAKNVAQGPADLTASCRYAPLIAAIARRYFPIEAGRPVTEKKVGGALKRTVREYPQLIDRRPFPIFVIVVTGGDCEDPTEAIHEIRRASHLPIFFQFAGISPAGIPAPDFAFLKRLDRLSDRWVDNCGFFAPRDFTDPAELFVGLLNEFPGFMRLERVKDMLIPPPDASEEPARPPTAVALAIPDDVDDDDILTEPSPEEVARLELERLERQRRRQQRAREMEAEAAALAVPRIATPQHQPRPRHQRRQQHQRLIQRQHHQVVEPGLLPASDIVLRDPVVERGPERPGDAVQVRAKGRVERHGDQQEHRHRGRPAPRVPHHPDDDRSGPERRHCRDADDAQRVVRQRPSDRLRGDADGRRQQRQHERARQHQQVRLARPLGQAEPLAQRAQRPPQGGEHPRRGDEPRAVQRLRPERHALAPAVRPEPLVRRGQVQVQQQHGRRQEGALLRREREGGRACEQQQPPLASVVPVAPHRDELEHGEQRDERVLPREPRVVHERGGNAEEQRREHRPRPAKPAAEQQRRADERRTEQRVRPARHRVAVPEQHEEQRHDVELEWPVHERVVAVAVARGQVPRVGRVQRFVVVQRPRVQPDRACDERHEGDRHHRPRHGVQPERPRRHASQPAAHGTASTGTA